MKPVIRDATPADRVRLNDIVHGSSAYGGEYAAMLDGYDISDDQLRSDVFRLAELDGDVVAFYSLVESPAAELDLMFVADSAQGTGTGQALFADLLVTARDRGISTVRIVSHPPALGFYERMGAQRVGTQLPRGRVTWERPILQVFDGRMTGFTFETRLEDGIEWISCHADEPRHETPILMQHGMWHGAWCWQPWQEALARQGWTSHAISLPGHGGSPPQRNHRLCTLGYYLGFLADAAASLPQRPVLMGHSMGGALIQHYLKKVADDLPAAVLVASWPSHGTFASGLVDLMRLDPWGALLSGISMSATHHIRNPEQAAKRLISADAEISAEDLHARLDPESQLVLNQHNPPFWFPKKGIATPMLWVAGDADAAVNEPSQRQSAAFYGADYEAVEGAAHNLMMERDQAQTIARIEDWLADRIG